MVTPEAGSPGSTPTCGVRLLGVLLAVLALVAAACGSPARPELTTTDSTAAAGSANSTTVAAPGTVAADVELVPATTSPLPTVPPTAVRTGAGRLVDSDFAALDGRRVGLIANQTSVVDGTHLIDLLDAAPNVDLVALFAPEHGIRGEADGGELVDDELDVSTGLQIFSLYGETRTPTPDMLTGLDVLVFDVQDVGARFYTFISTMGLAMEAAATQGVAFMVLDRPIPGTGVDPAGFVLEAPQLSFIGQYPIPPLYAMTVGELARAIQGEGWMPGLTTLQLEIVELAGWTRSMQWPETELEWIPPSRGLPTFESALVYPGTVLFEATAINYGTGSYEPFTSFGAPWADGEALAADLNARNLPGVRFEPKTYTPVPLEGLSYQPRLEGELLQGVRYVLTDRFAFRPIETGIHVLDAFNRQAVAFGVEGFLKRPQAMDLLSGTDRLMTMLRAGTPAEEIIASFTDEAAAFDVLRQPYLLYDE